MNKLDKNIFDLEERTAIFSEQMIDFCKTISRNHINATVITQLIKSTTSIGANYMEANAAESRRDFLHKIHICKKEAKETTYWLRLMINMEPNLKGKIKVLFQEAKELTLIFSKISLSTKNNSKIKKLK